MTTINILFSFDDNLHKFCDLDVFPKDSTTGINKLQ